MINERAPRQRREDWEDDKLTRIILIGALGLWVAATGVATAQDAKDRRDPEDSAMERRVRHLGLDIGRAYACTEEKGRQLFKEETHLLFDLIVQDVGSDLAFLYATSIGIGSTEPKEKLDCPALLKRWEEIREDYELKGDE
jgi:hypothetical protein